jgi:C-terminal processing protease CtpA/Prc
MVDLMGEAGVLLAERVVREFGEVGNGVKPLQVLDLDVAQVLGDNGRALAAHGIEPTLPVKAGI